MTSTPATLALLAIGVLGAMSAFLIGIPMPFLIGALVAVAGSVILRLLPLDETYRFPELGRRAFIALIGALIGATFTAEAVSDLSAAWITFAALTVFIIASFGVNYVIYRRGGYDRDTAFFASVPGGLVEAVILAEDAGADTRAVTLQHFVRIILIIILVPFIVSLLVGVPVGSAAGETFERGFSDLVSIPIIIGVASLGLIIGIRLKLPAGQFMGPLIIAAGLHVTGILDTHAPGWMIWVAQLVIGTALGARFAGITHAHLIRALTLGLVSVLVMLGLGSALALWLIGLTDQPFEVLLICFAPGGVTETGLIALSLEANPVFVAVHHLFRIIVAILIAQCIGRWLFGLHRNR